jgi:ABC-type multidrug transport system ATPase subunit
MFVRANPAKRRPWGGPRLRYLAGPLPGPIPSRLFAAALQPLSDLTVLESPWFFAGVYRVPPRTASCRIKTLLSQLDLFAVRQKRAGQLSGGFKQLLAVGCALLHNPPLLLLDEPTSGLDPTG